jgi:signal transduction histidine kinase
MVYYVDETWQGQPRANELFPFGDGLTSLVLRTGEAFLLDQQQTAELIRSGRLKRVLGNQSYVHWLGVPLIMEEQTIGAIVTQSYEASVTYSQQDLALLKFVAQHVSDAFGKVRARLALQKIQDELVLRNQALGDALANLQAAQGELVRQERLASLGALVAGVAHEINTPLGVCVTATSHLEEELQVAMDAQASGPLNDDQLGQFFEAATDAVRILKSNTRRAAKLINSFKQVSVDQASGEMRSVNLAEYLNEVLATLRPVLKSKPVLVHVSCAPDFIIDTHPGALAQVITNLVMNSVIHGFEGRARGAINIQASRDGDALNLRYSDDGNGTDETGLKKIFDPFYTTTRGTGGSGLGAHIVYNLITGPLGGRIQVSSAPGQGLHFDIRMPIKLVKPYSG